MLNPFPQLLVYSFDAPTLLRITVAVAFVLMALRFIKMRKQAAETPVPLVGAPGIAIVYFAAIVEALMGLALFFGWETQIAALLGIVVSLKHAWLAGRYPVWSPRSRSVYIFMAIICLSLMLTGAGAYAMDLRL
jgi:uncharacterized membrane protein YphA (DoxX/SURF4 family)